LTEQETVYGVTDLKKGTLIQLDGKPYRVVDYAQKQMGRGGSIVNTKLKNLLDGSVIPKTFKGQEKVESADVTNNKLQFLYKADTTLHFMDESTYEQFELSSEDVTGAEFLKDGMSVTAQLYEGRVINVELPVKISLEVLSTPDVVRGDTQSTVMKQAELETGTTVQVPIFIKTGDNVIIDTRDGSYVEREKR